jgi:hypothetical protein
MNPVAQGITSGDISIVLFAVLGGAVALGLAVAVLVVAVKITGGLLSAIGWLIKHVAAFIGGVVADIVRFVGAVVAALVAIPFATFNVVLGRWPAAGRWGRALRRETMLAGYSVYSIVLRRPLKLFCLDGLVEGVETRLPQRDAVDSNESVAAATPPMRASGPASFEGYTIEGTLRPGGSGAKLYVATPDADRRKRLPAHIDKVVLKSFALEEGSSLPQIVRESRALDAARSLGLVLDHGLDGQRFWYAMPYHAGDNLNEMTRLLHARSGPMGLDGPDLAEAVGYANDLVATLVRYHQGGLWHKDVKPDNIMVHDGRAHLVDLGLVTPLRSAMTLTTHGTEYFRDPEMVRQALRGVRVHQVDGAKFDVYGAGAVLYFVLENTFPAHGGLSSFAKKSPEALRWIVRRAMADYHQRYASAEAMLADLRAFAAAADPWSMKPIELPSMRGIDVAGPVAHGLGAVGAGIGAGFGGSAGPYAGAVPPPGPGGHAGWMPPPPVGGAAAVVGAAGRPALVVENWWTGAYRAAGHAHGADAAARAAVDAAQVRRMSRKEEKWARKEEKRALKEARKEARKAAKLAAKEARSNPPRLASAIGVVLLAMLSIVVFGRSIGSNPGRSTPQERSAAYLAPASLAAPEGASKLLLVNTHPAAPTAEVAAKIDALVQSYEARGFAVERDDTEGAARILLALGKSGLAGDEANVDLDAALAAGGYWGALHVYAKEGAGPSIERFTVEPVGAALTTAIDESRVRAASGASRP